MATNAIKKIASLRGTNIIGEIRPRYIKQEDTNYHTEGKYLWPSDALTGDAYIISEDADKIPVEEGVIFPDINAKKGDIYVCKGYFRQRRRGQGAYSKGEFRCSLF